VYANAFEFGPRDFDAGKILPPSNFPQLDLGRQRTHVGLCPKFLVLFCFSDEPWNPWQMLAERLGSAEPRLKITALWQ